MSDDAYLELKKFLDSNCFYLVAMIDGISTRWEAKKQNLTYFQFQTKNESMSEILELVKKKYRLWLDLTS